MKLRLPLVIGALLGAAVGMGVGAYVVHNSSGSSETSSLWFVITVPAGLLVSTIVGVVIGGRGAGEPLALSNALDLSRPHAPVPLRIAVTVTF